MLMILVKGNKNICWIECRNGIKDMQVGFPPSMIPEIIEGLQQFKMEIEKHKETDNDDDFQEDEKA